VEKVYCKNCKFSNFVLGHCEWLVKNTKKNPYSGRFIEPNIIVGNSTNVDGVCQYYQRKWWKFWIK